MKFFVLVRCALAARAFLVRALIGDGDRAASRLDMQTEVDLMYDGMLSAEDALFIFSFLPPSPPLVTLPVQLSMRFFLDGDEEAGV